ncbi:MAG: flagellar hook-length control protein FliK [Lachnospirales bacterium]
MNVSLKAVASENLVLSSSKKDLYTKNDDFSKVLDSKKDSNISSNRNETDYDNKKSDFSKDNEFKTETENVSKNEENTSKTDEVKETENTSKTDEVKETEKSQESGEVSENEIETNENLTENLKDLMYLLSNFFAIPVDEVTSKISEMIENGEELTMQNLLSAMKNIVGEDVNLLSLEGIDKLLEQGKIILDDINLEMVDTENSDELLQNLLKTIEDSVKTTLQDTETQMATNTQNITNVEVVKKVDTNVDEEVEVTEEVEIEIVDDTVETMSGNNNQNQSQSNEQNNAFTQSNVIVQSSNANVNLNVDNNTQFQQVEQLTQSRMTQNIDTFKAVDQIIENMRVEVKADVSEIKISLKPDHLGDVTLKIATNNGIITAQFMAENQRVKELIESQFTSLEDTLKQQGIDVGALSVEVSSEQNNQSAFEQGRSTYNAVNLGIDSVEEEVITVNQETLDENGSIVQSRVNYQV